MSENNSCVNFRTEKTSYGVEVVFISGPLDILNSAKLWDRLSEIIRSDVLKVVVDVAQVELLVAGGVSVFLNAQKELLKRGGNLKISGVERAGDGFQKVFKIATLNFQFETYVSAEDAVASFGPPCVAV